MDKKKGKEKESEKVKKRGLKDRKEEEEKKDGKDKLNWGALTFIKSCIS